MRAVFLILFMAGEHFLDWFVELYILLAAFDSFDYPKWLLLTQILFIETAIEKQVQVCRDNFEKSFVFFFL